MSEIEFLCFNQVNPEDFMAVVNEDSLRTHLIDHPYFDAASLQEWMGDKIKVDAIENRVWRLMNTRYDFQKRLGCL